MPLLLLYVHVVANLVWIGSISAVALILGAGAGSPQVRGQIGRKVYSRLSAPAFGVSFLAGLLLLASNLHGYLVVTHYMHAKLTLALAVIALHHMLGARAKRMASGALESPGPAALFGVGIVLLAAGAAFFVLVKPF